MPSVLDTKSPLLWRACLAGEVAMMERVMEQGVDPRKMDRNGENCLHMCARSGEVDAFQRMVQEGLDPDTSNHNGQTPLHVAVAKGHTGMVRHIVRSGANTDLRSKFSGMTALHVSCVEEEADTATFLLDNGANCAIKDAIGKYADDYTRDEAILKAFESHFPVCTHGRKPDSKGGNSRGGAKTEQNHSSPLVTAAVLNDVSSRGSNNKKDAKEMDNEKGDADDDNDEDDADEEAGQTRKMRRKDKKRSSKRERDRGALADRKDVEIYDKMEHYDVDRARGNWNKAKDGGKKVKVNHSLGFSDQHKQRMSQNVFDRLMGGGKKK